MKFAQIQKGPATRKRAIPCTTLDGVEFVCDLQLLCAEQESEAIAAACKAAKAGGGEPNERDLSYQMAFAAEVVARAAIDPDSAEAELFFSSVEEVRKNLDRERILLLANIHRYFHESVSPMKHELNTDEFAEMVSLTASVPDGADPPHERLPRFTRNSFVRGMAVLLMNARAPVTGGSVGN